MPEEPGSATPLDRLDWSDALNEKLDMLRALALGVAGADEEEICCNVEVSLQTVAGTLSRTIEQAQWAANGLLHARM
jgi:hypothetical protein